MYCEGSLLILVLLLNLYLMRTRPSKEEVCSLLKISCINKEGCVTQRISKLRQDAQLKAETGETILKDKALIQKTLDEYIKKNRRKTKI